jgi:hypothetical protein
MQQLSSVVCKQLQRSCTGSTMPTLQVSDRREQVYKEKQTFWAVQDFLYGF